MQASVAVLGALTAFENDIVLVELTLFNGDIDLDNVLPDDTTCANVQVTKFC